MGIREERLAVSSRRDAGETLKTVPGQGAEALEARAPRFRRRAGSGVRAPRARGTIAKWTVGAL